MPRDMAEKLGFAELMKRIEALGGFAAVDFKGLFLVFLPKTCDLDVSLELKRIAGIPKSVLQQRWNRTMRWLANFR
jgi:hypothetical protein